MEYRLGNSKKIKEHGETTEIECPKCKSRVKFSVYTNFEARLTAELPLVKTGNVYFLVCSKCAAVFGVDADKGKTFEKGQPLAILTGDLKELKEFEV